MKKIAADRNYRMMKLADNSNQKTSSDNQKITNVTKKVADLEKIIGEGRLLNKVRRLVSEGECCNNRGKKRIKLLVEVSLRNFIERYERADLSERMASQAVNGDITRPVGSELDGEMSWTKINDPENPMDSNVINAMKAARALARELK